MKSLRFTLWVALLLSISHVNTRAQSPTEPIKAKQRELSYQIQPDGSRVLKHEQAGVFYRSSSGASIKTMGDRSTLIDAHGDHYEINHNKKLAKLVAHLEEPPHEVIKNLKNLNRPVNMQDEVVNGLVCAVLPLYSDPTGNRNAKPSGRDYLYLPYGLLVKSEFADPDGSLLTVRELYDIEIIEPDPALVRIPEGYSIDLQPQQ